MVNKNILWTTAVSAKRIVDLFSSIDPVSLDLVQNDLKCHLDFCWLLNSDVILWNETFLADDSAAFQRGNKFLIHWVELNHPGPPRALLSFADSWEQFKKSEKLNPNLLKQVSSSKSLVTPNTQPAPGTTNPNPSNPINNRDLGSGPIYSQAGENDWEKYASKFHVTDLDRLMIEETAKAEGLMRMVFDEAANQVVGLKEYTRRVLDRARTVGSIKVSSCGESNPGNQAKKNHLENLNGSQRVGKRKAENGAEDDIAPVEKKGKLSTAGMQ